MSNYDIDYLINLIYEFYYLKNSDKCFDIIDIEPSDMDNIDNVKIIPIPNKVNSYINQIFNADISYINKYE